MCGFWHIWHFFYMATRPTHQNRYILTRQLTYNYVDQLWTWLHSRQVCHDERRRIKIYFISSGPRCKLKVLTGSCGTAWHRLNSVKSWGTKAPFTDVDWWDGCTSESWPSPAKQFLEEHSREKVLIIICKSAHFDKETTCEPVNVWSVLFLSKSGQGSVFGK